MPSSYSEPSIPPSSHLTTFPNPFQDEPEQGILPAFLSKVKQTFTSGISQSPTQNSHAISDRPPLSVEDENRSSHDRDSNPVAPSRESGQTEAQAIAEAVMRNRIQTAVPGPLPNSAAEQQQRMHGQSTGSMSAVVTTPAEALSLTQATAHPSNSSIHISHGQTLNPPLSAVNAFGSSESHSPIPPSVASSQLPTSGQKRPVAPGGPQWRPSGVAPAQVTVSPVTTTVQTASKEPISSPARPIPFSNTKASHRSNANLQTSMPSSSRAPTPLSHHTHTNPLSMSQNKRLRRSSIATLPDSPSSLSISGMIAANAELTQRNSYVPGFPLAQDDIRSVRSMGAVKRLNSVSRIIKRMKGDGLSKQYWMADEHCKECYDCKSVFTAWRRKHHCRICGQIFCSRCASNIIGARRFGQDGVVRVCNLCLKIMEEYKEDEDDDDRRSINSFSTSVHRYPSISERTFLNTAMSPEMSYAKSPFAASQLFSSHPNDSLMAIDEASVPMRWDDTERAFTSNEVDESPTLSGDDRIWAGRPPAVAPFRRPVELDQKVAADQGEAGGDGHVITPVFETSSSTLNATHGDATSFPFPRTNTMSTDGDVERAPLSREDSDHPLIGLKTRMNQAVLTALLDSEKSEGLWRARSHSFAHQPEMLAGASLQHFKLMLAQAIARAELPKADEWHQILTNLILKVPLNLQPNVRAGDDIDVRAYVKIKKVPGGKISDSEYVDGIVITKNVAHKAMSRRLVNPRIMVVTFPLDYHRVDNQFMSLDPILAQEKDYLRLLTKRIIDARPHIVLAQSSVSRIALDYLLEANIALARSVKASAIQQVARCTQADVVASMDRLVLEPRMGRCGEFRIQSFDHELIPGRRKTLMRFEGASREQGCTIILRGADLPTLSKVKVITDFMALVAYHLRNEMIMYNDEHNIPPPKPLLPTEYRELLDLLDSNKPPSDDSPCDTPSQLTQSTATLKPSVEPITPDNIEFISESSATPRPNHNPVQLDDKQLEKRDALEVTKQIAKSLEPYLTVALSSSAAILFPPPAILAKMAELDRRLSELRVYRDEAEAAQILEEETKPPEVPKDRVPTIGGTESETASLVLTSISEAAGTSSEVPSSDAMSAVPALSYPATSTNKSPIRDPYHILQKPQVVSQESALAQVEHAHQEQVRLWQWYTRRFAEQLRPENFQGIVYLSSLGCEGTEKPCVEPSLQHIDYYQAGDQTVGQFLENLAIEAPDHCTSKNCERLLLFHYHLLVHGQRRLQIAIDQFPCPSPGHEDQIITWSYCQRCATPSPTTIMREETWKMSWGTYLEQCFYPPEIRAGFCCPHDAFRDQIRYYAHRNLAIRIHNEQIDLFEPVRPSIKLQIKAETKAVLKNREYDSALAKISAFFDSVTMRLRTIDVGDVQSDKVTCLNATVESMLVRAASDREEIIDLLNRTYKLTPITDVLSLNIVLRALQDKVVQWDVDFADIEKVLMPTEKDLRKMTASHLKRLLPNQDTSGALERGGLTGTPSVVSEEHDTKDDDARIQIPSGKETTITGLSSNPDTDAATASSDITKVQLDSDDNSITPTAGILQPMSNPLSRSEVLSSKETEDDSDSTVSAIHEDLAGRNGGGKATIDPSIENDTSQFVSRLPRRSAPAPSDHSSSNRRRLRRGRIEQLSHRQRNTSRPGLMSDGDRSYATNASRISSSYLHKPAGESKNNDYLTARPSMGSRAPSYTNKVSPRSGKASPKLRHPVMTPIQSLFSLEEGKPRIAGKCKSPRYPESDRSTPIASKNSGRHSQGGTSRVISIARHLDRLSREAEKERQKRISVVRGKRARPVSVTKAKVQVFDNLRDAFRDEFDTDSSEADNEEDELGSDDSLGSADELIPKAEPFSNKSSLTGPAGSSSVPVATFPSPLTETSVMKDDLSTSNPLIASATTPSIPSDSKSEKSFTDRLKIELPSFETSAPLPSHPATPQVHTDTTTADEALGAVSASQTSDIETSTANEKSSLLKSLSGLWAFRAADFAPLEYPLSASEHIFADSKVIIRETEPTSIIAFTLSSKTYRDNSKMWSTSRQGEGRFDTFMPEEAMSTNHPVAWDTVSLEDVDEVTRQETGTHVKYDFESGASTIFCRIFFAEQFAALRKACNCEDSFVESLARCIQFEASGGKSGSAFLKSRDDRFIAKEITRYEMDALTKFAPAYFDYTRKAFQGQRPTVLAKIYGFFKIGFNNAITGKAMKMNVLVMENLFYERRFAKIYDLKGSTRNRLIQPTGRINEVLLDENLMEIVYKHPLYLREQSKRILRTALFNDTLFLSNLNVMDYSLVVGVDNDKHELVVGIVDYIRTFTWDKKLESWVKDLGAGGKGEPTIVTPKQYKLRFRTAMERFYFPSVPDRWTVIGPDEVQTEEDGLGIGTTG
ncbi:1-phosphatidylinositol-3-phosphate 5-kinase, putative [Cryptococcus gattii WM276]|uniref:1-phosphatidylinositol-3-phosphate 5-kinase n=1 Tax=Cryptococcus gattii serotype B (strain WM276 / ATCC MYA-4071) TaxID=367775 RepID=E6R4A4_CRYGW|nr:1-phosphatidylinositol-3-phosphate 5-kinase, putative [Cryptococcus gattii WM276]ADV21989.1 1-phosphatidylinositol-3-phosphate 5-kinase, putative [Cryptococcus gattii WM276]